MLNKLIPYNLCCSIASICSADDSTPNPAAAAPRPTQIFHLPQPSTAIHCLAFHNDHLLIGTLATVAAHRIIADNGGTIAAAAAWELKLCSASRTTNEPGEVNALWLDADKAQLYAGCGDNILYAIDVSTGTLVRDFSGHTDYIHSVTGASRATATDRRIFTGSEDGTVRFWDARDKRSAGGTLEPHREQRLARSELGRWIGTVSVNDDGWMLCGGGPRLALYHLRSLECTAVYGRFEGVVHVSGFVDDVVLAGGADSATVHEYSLNGELVAEVPVSGPAVYSAVWQPTGGGLLALGGASNRLDVCTNLRYRDVMLELYEPASAADVERKM